MRKTEAQFDVSVMVDMGPVYFNFVPTHHDGLIILF